MKNNGNFWKLMGIILVIILAVAGWIWNAATVCGDVNYNQTAIQELKATDSHLIEGLSKADKDLRTVNNNLQGDIQMTNEAIIRLQSDISYIVRSIDEIKADQKEIKQELIYGSQ